MARFKASLFLIVILFASLLLANRALEPVAAEPAADEYVFSHSWGAEGDQIRSPRGVAVTSDGTIYIANTGLDRITKISKATGASTFFNWGESGSGDGQFYIVAGIALDWDGNVYVVDGGEIEPHLGFWWLGNNRIQKFNSSGAYLTQWGSTGYGDGQFRSPGGVAVDKHDNVYVADSDSYRIQKFSQKFNDSSGVYEIKHEITWGASGSGEGQFSLPAGIALDRHDNVYVADTGNDRIQKFSQKIDDSSGVYEIKHEITWGASGSGEGQFRYPGGITARADKDGEVYVYVADRGEWDPEDRGEWIANDRIQKFSSNGRFEREWGESGSGEGQFRYPSGIAVNKAGNVYVADTGNDRIQKFNQKIDDSSGVYEIDYERQWGGSDGISDPAAITVDAAGNVYVVDASKSRIQKFSSYGRFEREWGEYGSGNGQFIWLGGIAIDGDGYVYVVDSRNHRIQKFYSSGAYLTQWGSEGSGEGQFSDPGGIAVDADGNVYVADLGNDRIQKFSSNGRFEREWGEFGSGEGQFYSLKGIAVGADGNVYVTDTDNNRIQKFSSSGAFQWTVGWGVQDGTPVFQTCASGCQAGIWGSGEGQFRYPGGIAVGADGNVYVTDTDNNRIQKFSSSGAYVTQWGSEGSAIKQFKSPSGIAVDREGDVFVADTRNHRIQVFSAARPAPDPTSGLVLNGSFENNPSLTPWVYRGNLSLPDALVEFEPGAHDYGRYALRLDVLDPPKQDLDKATAHQTFYIPDTWSRPRLTFRYNMFVNDIMDWSDFFVAIQDGLGFNHQATVLRDGYEPCPADQDEPPTSQHEPLNPLVELGWRFASYDLSAFKGKNIRVVFASRNLHPGSLGISTDIDDVRVLDVGAEQVYLPLLAPNHSYQTCDPVP